MRFDELPEKLQKVVEEAGVKRSSLLTAADLLTWKSGEGEEGEEEKMVLEFAQQYEN